MLQDLRFTLRLILKERWFSAAAIAALALGIGITGWVIEHGEAVLSNEAHLDPRSVQVPGTPFEPAEATSKVSGVISSAKRPASMAATAR